jgi:hypothetical protein
MFSIQIIKHKFFVVDKDIMKKKIYKYIIRALALKNLPIFAIAVLGGYNISAVITAHGGHYEKN